MITTEKLYNNILYKKHYVKDIIESLRNCQCIMKMLRIAAEKEKKYERKSKFGSSDTEDVWQSSERAR